MASRRGLSNQERLATDIICVTATGSVVGAPCYVYSIIPRILDTSTSGMCLVGNTTAAADLGAESTKIAIKIGNVAATAGSVPLAALTFNPPIYIQNKLFFASATGIETISVSYILAQ